MHLKLWKNKNTLSLCPITHTVTNPRPTKKNPKTKQEGLVRLSDEAEDDIALLTIFKQGGKSPNHKHIYVPGTYTTKNVPLTIKLIPVDKDEWTPVETRQYPQIPDHKSKFLRV